MTYTQNAQKIKKYVELYRERIKDENFKLDSIEKLVGGNVFWPTAILGDDQKVIEYTMRKFYLEVSYEIQLFSSPLDNEIPVELMGLERYYSFVDPYDGLECHCFRFPLE